MGKNKRGGKRPNSGRKKLADKKILVPIYVKQSRADVAKAYLRKVAEDKFGD